MNKTKILVNESDRDPDEILDSLISITGAVDLLALSTLSVDTNNPYINTAFFAASTSLELYFLSPDGTEHGKNLIHNPQSAVAIWEQPSQYGEGLRGFQGFGECQQVRMREIPIALKLYLHRFPVFKSVASSAEAFQAIATPPRFYCFRVKEFKLLDEARFVRREYIHGTIERQ